MAVVLIPIFDLELHPPLNRSFNRFRPNIDWYKILKWLMLMWLCAYTWSDFGVTARLYTRSCYPSWLSCFLVNICMDTLLCKNTCMISRRFINLRNLAWPLGSTLIVIIWYSIITSIKILYYWKTFYKKLKSHIGHFLH